MKAPKLRFKLYNNSWEPYKLGDLSSITTGKLDANAMKVDGRYDFYTSGIQKYKIDFPAFEGPAITIAGNGATVGYMHLADGKFNAYQRTYVLSEFKADRQFLFYEIGNKLPQKIAQEARTGSIPYIVIDILTGLNVNIPNEQEQKGIGKYFKKIDNIINENEKKLQKLKNLKQSFLQKMFPKEGKVIPEIRFKGFEGNWESTKLEKIFTERHEVSTITPEYPQLSFTIAEGVINPEDRKTNKRDFLIIDKANKKYLKTEVDDIIYNPSNIVFGAIHRNGLSKGVVSPIYKIFYTDQDAKFLDSLVTRKEFINETKKYLEGTVTKLRSLKPDAFLNIEVLIPPTIEEQIKIGKFFENIDKEIKLYEPKIEKLKNLKKSLLEKMFI